MSALRFYSMWRQSPAGQPSDYVVTFTDDAGAFLIVVAAPQAARGIWRWDTFWRNVRSWYVKGGFQLFWSRRRRGWDDGARPYPEAASAYWNAVQALGRAGFMV